MPTYRINPRGLLSLLSVSLLLSQPAFCQSPSSSGVQRDAQALTVIQKALVGLAGTLDRSQVSSIVVNATVSLPAANPIIQGTATIEESFSPSGNEFKDTFVSDTINQTFVSGHGSPGLVSNGTLIPFGPHFIQGRTALHFPWLALSRLVSDPNVNVAFVKQTALGKQPAIQLHFHNDSDIALQALTVQDWYFDPTTGLPLRVEYRVPSTPNGIQFVQVTTDFSSFQPVQGILIPFHIVSSADGRVERDMTITSVTINQPVASTDFDLPSTTAVTK